MRSIDLGCGGGAVTLEIGRLVAPDGHVVGLDLDDEKLGLARAEGRRQGLANVDFRRGSIAEWMEPSEYDVVYSRFLLHHLRDPTAVLARMWTAVRDGGVLVVEDADHEGWAIHPPNPGFDFFLHTFPRVIRNAGGDPTFGRKLFHACLDAGIPRPETSLVASLRIHEEGKAMAALTLESIADSIVSGGIATRDEVDVALTSLRDATNDPDSLFCGPRIFQVIARKTRRVGSQ